jgi:hypothetical protein
MTAQCDPLEHGPADRASDRGVATEGSVARGHITPTPGCAGPTRVLRALSLVVSDFVR